MNYCVRIVNSATEKSFILRHCDCAFSQPFHERENSQLLLDKICSCAEFIVAYNSQIMGFAAMYANDIQEHLAYITLIAVHPDFQRKNVGHCLIKSCIDIAASRGMKAIKLEVKCDNYAAIKLYEKSGFTFSSKAGDDSMYLIRKI